MDTLTKDAEKLLVLIYKNYKSRVNDGESRGDAKFIGGLEYLHDKLRIKFNLEDTKELLYELGRAGYLSVHSADNTIHMMTINDSLIIYGENRIAKNIKEGFEWAATITAPFKP